MEEAREYVGYLIRNDITIEEFCKQVGLIPKFILLVKIAYAEYCYNNTLYLDGDRLLQEVSLSKYFDKDIENALKEVRTNIKNKI